MPFRAPRICKCGAVVPSGITCACQERDARERKARFDKKRPSARQRGYTKEWEQASKDFLRFYPYCERCKAPATTVHHKVPHKGNQTVFWDKSNWMPVCKPCHDGPLQSAERRTGGWSSTFDPSRGPAAGPSRKS
ncbi:HNH endonuclease signature motif containing protein [Rhizobium sp. YJ-22]|uniref:HNH endonuclease signature motif containing protein n=1 Tax=Rhizobium sp. YJ-22 TaxID=3037556 RepID=UPI002412DC77|nr:HNH endonuclease signature motif containing protein [Rhizobium sp. YJ-22]MDG3575724.1 HNH endonuclease signature motif containing protein [Rhizobium sp. YJ-22]